MLEFIVCYIDALGENSAHVIEFISIHFQRRFTWNMTGEIDSMQQIRVIALPLYLTGHIGEVILMPTAPFHKMVFIISVQF